MPPLTVIALLIPLPVLLALSAFFSGCETALFSLSNHERHRLRRDGTLAGKAVITLIAERRSLLITLLLGNMAVNVLFFVISTMLLLRLEADPRVGRVVVSIASLVPLLAIILVGEVLPKLVAARLTMTIAVLCALPLLLLHRVIAPARVLLNGLVVTPLARLIAPPQRPPELSAEELEALLELSQQRGVIDYGEEDLLQQVLVLGQLKVRDLMTPRVDIQAFDLAEPPGELIELIKQSQLRHIPVYRKDIDHVAGIVYAREVLVVRPTTPEQLARLVRQVVFVPEMQRADQLLGHFRKTGTKVAIAVDEYGGTAGLVTIEDVVEQMVGEIAGATGRQDALQVQPIGPGVWRADARLSIHDWTDVLGRLSRVTGSAGVSTLGGLVMARLGRVPRVGDRTKVGNVTIEVEAMKGFRLQWLVLRVESGEAPAAAAVEAPEPSGGER